MFLEVQGLGDGGNPDPTTEGSYDYHAIFVGCTYTTGIGATKALML